MTNINSNARAWNHKITTMEAENFRHMWFKSCHNDKFREILFGMDKTNTNKPTNNTPCYHATKDYFENFKIAC